MFCSIVLWFYIQNWTANTKNKLKWGNNRVLGKCMGMGWEKVENGHVIDENEGNGWLIRWLK